MFSQKDIDEISTTLQRAVLQGRKLPEYEIAGWYFNEAAGPQFFIGGDLRIPPERLLQPLFFEPVRADQEPAAWRWGSLITQDKSIYRQDIEWKPLYTAR